MKNFNKNVFKQYDIRGIVKDDFSRDFITNLAMAYATFVSRHLADKKDLCMAIGRDARLSGPDLKNWFAEGLKKCGVKVIDLGMCPTPLVYYSMFKLPVDGAIMITGSHNPPEYNGFKLGFKKTTIHGEEIQQVREILEKGEFISGSGSEESYDIISAYIEHQIGRHQALKNCSNRPRVIVDAGNGTAGLVAPSIFKALGCEVIELFCEPDGNFPNHHPDPTVEKNLQLLIAEMKKTGADVGFSYDGDSDRLGVVDNRGNVLWGDEIMIVLARDLLQRNPHATVIGEVKCSTRMYREIEKAGGNPVMWKTGHSLIKNKMKESGALLAGEMSGHIFFAENYFGFDDAIHASLEVARILGQAMPGGQMSDFLKDLPPVLVTPEIRIDCEEELKFDLVNRVIELIQAHNKSLSGLRIKNINLIDGIRVEFDKGWGLVRASNTQPILVSRFEAEDPESLQQYREFVESKVREAEAGLMKSGAAGN
ncbi:MAG: phosphomannomutase/phosphoglucomutase [Candidatus Riflebacteria bacterium]